ncbi:hypothetical protein [Actinomyces faecalis]|uniref:hypothetical protein n=1 Tax=Actinomyces faecalis TaxID=2722820 RepID=UPI001554A388|nr:hypothetical protein [Actinomyces faecalis]
MRTRPKDIGTAAETALVRYAREHGHPGARRIALAGARDQGDVWLTEGIIVEVKAGHAAERASDEQVRAWWGQTVTERDNHGVPVGVLVTKRAGYSGARCGAWSAWVDLDTLHRLIGAPWASQSPLGAQTGAHLVRMSVASLTALTTRYAYRADKESTL